MSTFRISLKSSIPGAAFYFTSCSRMHSSSQSRSRFSFLIQSESLALGTLPPTFKADLSLHLIFAGKALIGTYQTCLINVPCFFFNLIFFILLIILH